VIRRNRARSPRGEGTAAASRATDRLVTFGESALDEMCFIWAYYHPSVGFQTHVAGL
jgi:hypothetical protein